MADVFVILQEKLPFSAVLRREKWEISYGGATKNRYAVIYARAYVSGKLYNLWIGPRTEMADALDRGFLVHGGTPERGLVTALRREGKAILATEQLPARRVSD
jgi:hypothetical protein